MSWVWGLFITNPPLLSKATPGSEYRYTPIPNARTASSFLGQDTKRKSPASIDQLSYGFTVKSQVVSLTCVPRLKPWPVIWLLVNFVTILPLQCLRFPPVQGDSDPRSVAIISPSWTELLRQEVERFDELSQVIKRHLLAAPETRSVWWRRLSQDKTCFYFQIYLPG